MFFIIENKLSERKFSLELGHSENDKILDTKPKKFYVEKKCDEEYLKKLNYDNTPPKNIDNSECL